MVLCLQSPTPAFGTGWGTRAKYQLGREMKRRLKMLMAWTVAAVFPLVLSADLAIKWKVDELPPSSRVLVLSGLLFASTIWAVVIIRLLRAIGRQDVQHLCIHCSYDLRAAISDVCPECGNPIEQTICVHCESCGCPVEFAVQTVGTRQICPYCGVASDVPE